MGNNIAFQSQGRTYKGNATANSQSVAILADSPCNQLLIVNPQSATTGNAVYITVSSNASVTVTPPGNGTPQYAVPIPPNTEKVITVPQQFSNTANLYVAFCMDANLSGSIYFTPGEGL